MGIDYHFAALDGSATLYLDRAWPLRYDLAFNEPIGVYDLWDCDDTVQYGFGWVGAVMAWLAKFGPAVFIPDNELRWAHKVDRCLLEFDMVRKHGIWVYQLLTPGLRQEWGMLANGRPPLPPVEIYTHTLFVDSDAFKIGAASNQPNLDETVAILDEIDND